MTTWIMLMLFGQHQPYRDALQIPCDILLELIESRLDEGLSSLKGESSRLARKSIHAIKSSGSVREFAHEILRHAESVSGDILGTSLPKP